MFQKYGKHVREKTVKLGFAARSHQSVKKWLLKATTLQFGFVAIV
jgi:hypothetical protein